MGCLQNVCCHISQKSPTTPKTLILYYINYEHYFVKFNPTLNLVLTISFHKYQHQFYGQNFKKNLFSYYQKLRKIMYSVILIFWAVTKEMMQVYIRQCKTKIVHSLRYSLFLTYSFI